MSRDIEIVSKSVYDNPDANKVPYGSIPFSEDYEMEAADDKHSIEHYFEGAQRAVDWRGLDGPNSDGTVA